MLTITDLIAVISLCATFYSLGYVRGKHDSKTQKLPPIVLQRSEAVIFITTHFLIKRTVISVAPFIILY